MKTITLTLVKSLTVLSKSKTNGEILSVKKDTTPFIVPAHTNVLNVKSPEIVTNSESKPKLNSPSSIPTVMVTST